MPVISRTPATTFQRAEIRHILGSTRGLSEREGVGPTADGARLRSEPTRFVRISRTPSHYLARACSPKKISVKDTDKGAQNYPLGAILSSSVARYRYGLKWSVLGEIKDCDLGTNIALLLMDWSNSQVDYYVHTKKSTKKDYESANQAWTENKEKFVADYTKADLVGAQASNYITESGKTWVRVADGPGGPVASWATAALVRYTVIAWIKGTDGKELSLRFWASLWAERDKPGEAFKVGHVYTHAIPSSVTP